MKKAFGKILTLILSLISFGAFLYAISTFASYYIDPLGYTYHSNKVVRDACVFGVIALLLTAFMITLIIVTIRSKKRRTVIILNSILAASIVLSLLMFFTGFGMIFVCGTNGCSYTTDIDTYGKDESDSFEISYFPEKITDDMTVIYNYTAIGSDIEVGNDPDAGEYYPKYLEKFNVEHDSENDFGYEYIED